MRLTPGQARRVWGLLVSAGDVWACVLELNLLRRRRGDAPVVGYQALCRELAAAGPGTFGELDSVGARSVLRRYSDAWMAAAKARRHGRAARFPRRKRRAVPVRWYAGTFRLEGRRLRLPTATGAPPLWLRLARQGDPVGVLDVAAGARHNQRVRDWRPGQLKTVLADKAQVAGVAVVFVDERGTSSTCPACALRVPKPKGRNFSCPHCGLVGHRDLVGAANIAARGGGTPVSLPDTVLHRRGGRHLPGVGRSRRDPRRRPPRRRTESRPAAARPTPTGESLDINVEDQTTRPPKEANLA